MSLDRLTLDLDVVLGKTRLPLGHVLRMGRGAVIALGCGGDDLVEIRANGLAIATGRVIVQGEVITVEVVNLIAKAAVAREAGATIGGAPRTADAPAAALAA
jgi:flagellar motor switch protein FliN/FliY